MPFFEQESDIAYALQQFGTTVFTQFLHGGVACLAITELDLDFHQFMMIQRTVKFFQQGIR